MKVVIFGAAGVLGQHLRLCIPPDVEPIWIRKNSGPSTLFRSLDLTDAAALQTFLEAERPDAIINLAGESRPDVVEKDPERYQYINAVVPGVLAAWCYLDQSHYVHVSTQAVFSGQEPPYGPESQCNPANLYGCQKHEAESRVRSVEGNWTIVRPTFVLGVRPMPAIGRMNPIEQMLAPGEQRHTDDRWFSVSFADEVARTLWDVALCDPKCETIHLGDGRFSRYDVAMAVEATCGGIPAKQSDFPGIASRPVDTSYRETRPQQRELLVKTGVCSEAEAFQIVPDFKDGFGRCVESFMSRETLGHSCAESVHSELQQRAREISVFTGQPYGKCFDRLARGFNILHEEVSQDFRLCDPKTDEDLLEWYRGTEQYVWELSAYHADRGFSYGLMCDGIATHLKSTGAQRILCLGDGIGDLTLTMLRAGFDATYHDLSDSRTAAFGLARIEMHHGWPKAVLTGGWDPDIIRASGKYDAVVSLDYLEHVTNVPDWAAVIHDVLNPGGQFCSWDAFGCGSGPDGAIPMHLARNDRFAKEWESHLAGLGFIQISDDWFRRAA